FICFEDFFLCKHTVTIHNKLTHCCVIVLFAYILSYFVCSSIGLFHLIMKLLSARYFGLLSGIGGGLWFGKNHKFSSKSADEEARKRREDEDRKARLKRA
ncbi:hypothetical protein Mgra_00004065, partial [Meloidogyne graminicola]